METIQKNFKNLLKKQPDQFQRGWGQFLLYDFMENIENLSSETAGMIPK